MARQQVQGSRWPGTRNYQSQLVTPDCIPRPLDNGLLLDLARLQRLI